MGDQDLEAVVKQKYGEAARQDVLAPRLAGHRGNEVNRVVLTSVLVALLFAQGCTTPTRTLTTVPRQGQLDEAMLRDTRDCEAAAERLSGYSNTGVVSFWARVVSGYTMIAVIVAGSVAAILLGGGRQSPQSSTGPGSLSSISAWIGSEPNVKEYLEKYQECMKARGYEVSGPAGGQ